MASLQIRFRVNGTQLEVLERRATEKGLEVNEYVKSVVLPPAAKVVSDSTGGKYPVSVVQLAMTTAEEVADTSVEFGTEVADWIESMHELVAWLADNPWHPECYKRAVAVMESIPAEVKNRIGAGVKGLIG